jgi:hypothetical protein
VKSNDRVSLAAQARIFDVATAGVHGHGVFGIGG